jgi:hypothetical protein
MILIAIITAAPQQEELGLSVRHDSEWSRYERS